MIHEISILVRLDYRKNKPIKYFATVTFSKNSRKAANFDDILKLLLKFLSPIKMLYKFGKWVSDDTRQEYAVSILKFVYPFLRSPVIGKQAEKSEVNPAELHTKHIPKFREVRAEITNLKATSQFVLSSQNINPIC